MYLNCPICGYHRAHPKHTDKCSKQLKILRDSGKLALTEKEPNRPLFPDHFDFKNGKRVVI